MGDISRHGVIKRAWVHMVYLGIDSLWITGVTALFVGMAFSVQIVREFLRFGAVEMIGGVVGLAVWRELGPLLTAVVVCGRVGSAIAAELASMVVTEQVDALKAMSVDVRQYLVWPRVVAVTLMLPLLVGIADIVAFLGGFIVAIMSDRVNVASYFISAQQMLGSMDIVGGLVKAMIFGLVISMISCYRGLSATAGAQGVGIASTQAVVYALMSVFVINYLVSVLLY